VRGAKVAALVVVASWPLAGGRARAQAPGPVVTLTADAPAARLQQQGPAGWWDVCASPCGLALDASASYRVGGAALRASDPFRLARPTGAVALDAKTVSETRHGVGLVLTIIGSGIALIGAYTLNASRTWNDTSVSDGTGPGRRVRRNIGLAELGAGGLFLAVGIPLTLGRTKVEAR
jgi:hypothetical protein